MIRKLAALGAACALACASTAAMAATTSGTISNGALSNSLAVTAATSSAANVVSFSVPGSTPIDASTTGHDLGTECFTIMRSQDGTNFAPVSRDVSGYFAHFCGPITVDLSESRSGTSYAIQADPGSPSFAYRIDQ